IAGRYYLRFQVLDRPHVLADIAAVLGRNGISIASVIQHEAPESGAHDATTGPTVPLVIMTHRTTEGNLRAAEEGLARLGSIRPPHVRMPVRG
ncbi:MAG: ACT domain-containing protein, partial [Planctomycetaceae bacterium]